MSAQIVRDLGRKTTDQIEALLQREIAIAQKVLSPADLALMSLKIASSVSISLILVIVQMAQDQEGRDQLFDMSLKQLHELDSGAKARAFKLLADAEAKLGR